MYGRKKAGHASPLVVHFHGGAFVSGDLDNGHTVAHLLEGAGAVVVSVAYPLTPFPQPVDTGYGVLQWVHSKAAPKPGDGATVMWTGMLHDITERKRMEAVLRGSEERYRTLVDLSPQVVWQCDADGSLSYCNSYWCEFTGLDEQQSRGDGWLVAVSANDRQRTAEQWQAALQRQLPPELLLQQLRTYKKITQHRVTMLGQDALRVKLHAFHRILAMAYTHDGSIIGGRSHHE